MGLRHIFGSRRCWIYRADDGGGVPSLFDGAAIAPLFFPRGRAARPNQARRAPIRKSIEICPLSRPSGSTPSKIMFQVHGRRPHFANAPRSARRTTRVAASMARSRGARRLARRGSRGGGRAAIQWPKPTRRHARRRDECRRGPAARIARDATDPWRPSSSRWLAEVPELAGVMAYGPTRAAAMAKAGARVPRARRTVGAQRGRGDAGQLFASGGMSRFAKADRLAGEAPDRMVAAGQNPSSALAGEGGAQRRMRACRRSRRCKP